MFSSYSGMGMRSDGLVRWWATRHKMCIITTTKKHAWNNFAPLTHLGTAKGKPLPAGEGVDIKFNSCMLLSRTSRQICQMCIWISRCRKRLPKWFIGERMSFDDQTRPSMKKLTPNFVPDMLRKNRICRNFCRYEWDGIYLFTTEWNSKIFYR